MNTQQALQLLGLSAGADQQAINTAYQQKAATIDEKLATAPTEGLKEKFIKMQTSLQQAQKLLIDDATEKTSSSPLSQTKLADLPGMGEINSAKLNLQKGQILAGRYEIQEQIGAGGMGAVYRAFDSNTDKDIALKVLLPELLKHQRAKERFLDEARLSQQLSHPNITNVYDVQQQGEYYFLTMELLEGQDLRQVMENRKLAHQPFAVDEVQEIISAISEGLAYAHKHTVHRDIKPENIWLTEEGEYKVMDFGIAQIQSTSQRTQTGAAMGTAYYMAPEQLKGAKNIDGRADQYALAVLAYELLSGEVPAGMIEPIKQHRKDTPKTMANAIHKALSPRPENRFEKIEQFSAAIASKKNGISLPALPIKAIALILILLGMVGAVATLASNGSLDSILQALKPINKEDLAKQKAEVARSLGEIKTHKQRLETARRNLNADVRDAERNNSKQLKALQYWQQITEDNLFAGSKITELEGELSVAETLLREEAFAQAQQSMDTVRKGYKAVWDEFTAAEQLYNVEQSSQQTREHWHKVKQNNGLGDNAEEKNAQTHYQQATQALLAGEINSALSSFKQAVPKYQALINQAQQLAQAREQAKLAKRNWLKRKKNYRVSAKEQQAMAEKADEKAQQAEKAGAIGQALEQYQQEKQHWEGAYNAVNSKVAKVEEQRAVAKAKARAYVQRITPKMIRIPAGSFRMGDLSGDGSSDEKPVHRVSISAFKMSQTEITFAQYDAYAAATGKSKPKDEGWGRGNRPVINVSWHDAVAYAKWLSQQTGKRFRLPSESEWEYAARAGGSSKYSWGNSVGSGRANCNGCGSRWDDSQTAAVASFSANSFGLYDMHGNVWEWTQDCRKDSYNGYPSNNRANTAGGCSRRVARGGSWNFEPWAVRSASRGWDTAPHRDSDRGFRLAQD